MRLRRREFIVALAASGFQLPMVTPLFAQPSLLEGARLYVFDSRAGIVDQRALRRTWDRRTVIDVARMDCGDWMKLARSGLSRTDVVTGMTGWQDFVVLRDLFRDAGFWQARPERRIDLPTGAALFAWRLSR